VAVRIAGVRVTAEYARLLRGIVERAGFDGTAARLGQAIDMRITTEVPLMVEEHDAILAALQGDCPPGLYRLRTELEKDQRLRRGPVGG
jgi:hypothetical protein